MFFDIYTGARKGGINSVDTPKFRRDPDEPDYYGQVSNLVKRFFKNLIFLLHPSLVNNQGKPNFNTLSTLQLANALPEFHVARENGMFMMTVAFFIRVFPVPVNGPEKTSM